MKSPLPRGHPLNPNAAKKDTACITAPLIGGIGCPRKTFPCGGYPVDKKITQVFKAGEIINITFWNPNFPNGPSPADAKSDQARHNGGLCEFALSYDGGKTYTVIGTYHKTCPDIFFSWPIKIPDNAPNCDNPGQCIFSWSWINAVGNREFYQNCADVKIEGNSTKPLPIKDITRANFPPLFPKIYTPQGDRANTGDQKGSGPSQSDVAGNMAMTFDASSANTSSTSDIPSTTSNTTSDIPSTTSDTPFNTFSANTSSISDIPANLSTSSIPSASSTPSSSNSLFTTRTTNNFQIFILLCLIPYIL